MKKPVKILAGFIVILLAVILLGVVYVFASWDRAVERPVPPMKAPRDPATIARGKYIYEVTWQCWACHQTAPASRLSAPSGGMEFDLRSVGPGFGVYYTRNITPDSATGIGTWTDGEIVQALREGINKDRRSLFPIMPTDWLKNLSDEDALAIVAFLRSVPPVRNPVPKSKPSFVAKALMAFNIMKPLPPISGAVNAPPRAASAEYGKYFTTALSGCADCHTPRNLQNGQVYLDSLFTGSSILYGEAEGSPLMTYAPNLRPRDHGGVNEWNEEQFMTAVTVGVRPDSVVLAPHMPYPHYKFLADDDLRAAFAYLKSLSSMHRENRPPRWSPAYAESRGIERGALIFRARCQACHGPNGRGAVPTSVTLAEVIHSLEVKDLQDFIVDGHLPIRMPGFRKTLSQDETRDLILFLHAMSPVANENVPKE